MRSLERSKSNPLLKGRIELAEYKEQEIIDYADNPYIEALPAIFTEEKIIDQFTRYPILQENERFKSKNLRFHMIKRLKNFIQPLPDHFSIEGKLSSMIRRGYLARNPLDKSYFERLKILNEVRSEKKEEREQALISNMEHIRSTADSLSIIGISGIGKTTAIERLLLMYPQIIKHEEYKGKLLSRTQLVWLKIDCPYDGSLSTLCKSFFKAIDDLLGTRYLEKYGYLNRITSSMLLHMTSLANIYGIGILVIDEIQHLINAKNDSDEMLNFFVTLTNTVGIPTVLIGTFKALKIFKKDFRQARRAGSEGNIIWDRMSRESDEWDFFIETLWEFQWLREKTELTQEMKDLFYDQCQGITSVAVNLFTLAQERALNTDKEKLTKAIIKKASKEDLHMIQPMIKALRSNNREQMNNYEDIAINLDDISFSHKRDIDLAGKIKEMAKHQEKYFEMKRNNIVENLIVEVCTLGIFDELTEKELGDLVKRTVQKFGVDDDFNVIKAEVIKKAINANEKKKIGKNIRKDVPYEEKDLRKIFKIAKQKKVHAYELLKQKGYIKDPVKEFIKAE
ncbi:ATP-binding protein [Crassaminicella indica]|uniref:ATP-binding protein n=1 Tax=Crassaminicella indica TaxID=2855394 RepID=A0ABX8RC92_9CLOT|nr:ATP-binding protein [Crassaminicella indica]QXM06633.1 ATP-binding protein [Crassaminicella indica]